MSYGAFVGVSAHGLHQLVHVLVVLHGVPKGVLCAQQPLAQPRHLRVQGGGVQHGEPPVVRGGTLPTLGGVFGCVIFYRSQLKTIKHNICSCMHGLQILYFVFVTRNGNTLI